MFINIDIVNNSADELMPARYNKTYAQSIIAGIGAHSIAVSKFTIPNNNIPLFIFKNTYVVTVVNGTASSSQSVQFNHPCSANAVYTIQSFLDMINTTIGACCNAVGISTHNIPYVWLDKTSQLQKIHFSNNIAWLGTEPQLQLWFNWDLFYFFQSMQVYFSGQYTDNAYRILVKNNHNNYTNTPNGGYEMSQETQLLSLYRSVTSIIITSDSLCPGNNIINTYYPALSSNYSDNFMPYNYNPTSYQSFELMNDGSLNQIDLQIYYTDNANNVSPLYLLPGQVAKIELALDN